MDKKVISTNRKAFHDFLIFDKFIAGIVLTGTEIKSIRKGMLNLKDSFAKIEDGEAFLYGMHISPYEQGNRFNHKPDIKLSSPFLYISVIFVPSRAHSI